MVTWDHAYHRATGLHDNGVVEVTVLHSCRKDAVLWQEYSGPSQVGVEIIVLVIRVAALVALEAPHTTDQKVMVRMVP
jgi:hypothetical protein